MNCMITGGAGFIGAPLVEYLLEHTDWKILVVDALTYASLDNKRLWKIQGGPRFAFCKADIRDLSFLSYFHNWDPDYIVHLAAETHVERSIVDPTVFLQTNVTGTYRLLAYAQLQKTLKKFLYFSTDEVFGDCAFKETAEEDSAYRSGNPYAATKAAGEELTLAWGKTFHLPVVISHCSNVFGPAQHEEKFIPKLVQKISRGEKVFIHADHYGNIGSRMYVHVNDVARAVKLLLEQGEVQQKYNIPGREVSNLDMARLVALSLGKRLNFERLCPDVTRPGWDFTYRISGKKLKELGWKPSENFHQLLNQTIQSYANQTKPQE